jgi:hypothetical protein
MAVITITINIDPDGVAVRQEVAPASASTHTLLSNPSGLSGTSLARTAGRVTKWTRLRASFNDQSGGEGPRTGP